MGLSSSRMPCTSRPLVFDVFRDISGFVLSSVIRCGIALVTTGFGHAALVFPHSVGHQVGEAHPLDQGLVIVETQLRHYPQAHGAAKRAADVAGGFGQTLEPSAMRSASFSSCKKVT